ncbi:MAG: PqqD family protein, partial [Anaerolineae bacterium]|nr:PqqD family protein [Anaerolineae bacterium]
PVILELGDFVHVTFQSDLVSGEYIWQWRTRIESPRGQVKGNFQQSTFFGVPLALDRLHKRASGYVPQIDESGQVDRFILDRMDGKTTVHSIADAVAARFPANFPTVREAMIRVADLSERYSS